MEPRKFAVHNQTRDVALSPSVVTVNAALEPLKVLKVLIEGLPANAKSGLWLTSFKGVPVARTLSPFDLVYLDKENHVILGVELSKDGEFTPPKGQPASALVLPPKSLAQSKTRAGDQLEFRPAAAEEPAPAAAAPAQAVSQEGSLPSPEAAQASPAARTAPAPTAAAPSPNFFASLLPQPAPIGESAAAATPVPAETHPDSGLQTPDILRREEPPSNPFAFPDAPRSPLIRPAPEPAEPLAPSTQEPIHEPFWTKRSAVERSLILPSAAPIAEPQPRTGGISAAAAPLAPVPVEEPSITGPEPSPDHYRPPAPKRKYPWKVKLLRWLFPDLVIKDAAEEEPHERRRADRQSLTGLIAYYFTGGSPEPQKIANISVLGFYLQTDERWMPGTIVRMTLQRVGSTGEDPSDTITVNSRIVRWGADGEGFEFILTDLED